MISFKVIPGKNCKIFVYITNIKTKQDLEIYDIVKKILTRTEYKPFTQGFNKNITYTYLINDYLFPIQFWPDVKKQLDNFIKDQYVLENEDLIFNNDIDEEDFDEWLNNCTFPEEIKLTDEYQYQRDSVFLALKNKIGRIEVATSGGKTFITYLYCRYLMDFLLTEDQKILIVVPSKLLCTQLQKDFKEYDKYFKRHITVETIFTGSKRIIGADVVCGTFASLGNYEQEYFDDYSVLICDEVHRAKAYTIRNEIYSKLLKCEYFFAMTGTMPKYNTLDYLHIVSMFGNELVKQTAKQNIDAGVSTPLKIHAIQIKYIDPEIKNYAKNLKESGIIGIEKYRTEKNFFQTYESRTQLIAKLLNAYSGNSLIMVDTVEYCQILENFLIGKCPNWEFHQIHHLIENRDEIIENMRIAKDHYCIIATYGTMSTGVSIKNIENIYFPDGGKSEIRIRQSLGRGMRLFPSKEFCNIFDFQDMMPYCSFINHSRERNRIYTEQRFPVKITEVKI